MKLKSNYHVVLVIICIKFSLGFDTIDKRLVPEMMKVIAPVEVLFQKEPVLIKTPKFSIPFLGNSYLGFKEALAFKESQGNYFVINDLGYLGKYQFGIETLKLMGVYSEVGFVSDPKLQEKVFHINLKRNKWILRNDIKRHRGKSMNQIKVTESGILAAAHLAGAGNVKKYLRSNGRLNVEDAYGTKLSDYLRDFSGYDISNIKPQKNPKIKNLNLQ